MQPGKSSPGGCSGFCKTGWESGGDFVEEVGGVTRSIPTHEAFQGIVGEGRSARFVNK